MPELAELRLTADYINQISKDKIFYGIRKNPEHKGLDISNEVEIPFVIEAKSRGKELMLELSTPGIFATSENMEVKHLMMTMGMSGHFKWVEDGVFEKHAHLLFRTEGGSLAFVDVRRFGKWKWGYWNKDRGPDPTTQHKDFLTNVLHNLNHRDFQKPIHEVLMNQRWFNGIGNYLRAEILYRLDIDPFMSAKDAIMKRPRILELCKSIPEVAYKLGGGQLKDWKNPFGTESLSWDTFMLCYGNSKMSSIEDRNGRRFWFNPKWNKQFQNN
jgi:endonuclease VIII-like 1